jgi:DNA adenine methylase
MFCKPIIKWVGGKTQIIDKIIDNFPTNINNYHELFLGGGSVLLALLSMQKNGKIKISSSINAYDINPILINMFINIRDNPQEIYKYIKKLLYHFNKIIINNVNNVNERKIKHTDKITSKENFYYWLRYKFNKLKKKELSIRLSAIFIFLNKTCFRGVYREGPNGFNVPYGNYNTPEVINKLHLMEISKLIQNVNFYNMGFEQSFYKIHLNDLNDFIYLDPPYAPINNTSFVDYVADGFNIDKHKKLFELIKNKSKNNKIMMSNSDVKLVKETFKDYKIITILCKRSINSKNPESKVNEVLIFNY